MAAVMQRVAIHGEATCSASWADWLKTAGVPALSFDHPLSAGARLVVVAPHPDDELLACGALVQMHAERGGQVRVVAVTDGEASHPGLSAAMRVLLAQRRRQERLRGLACLGLARSVVQGLGLPDGQVAAHRASLAASLRALLQPQDVIVSTWAHDGHPDHQAAGQVCRDVAARRGCSFLAAPVWMWHWAAPGDARVPWRRLRRLPIDGRAHACKQAALAEHRSQLAPRDAQRAAVLGPAIRARAAWHSEYYFV
jgi:LmbE family N-acetylglucosaminyl deacetylase